MNTIRHRIEEILKKLAPKAEESYHLVGSEPFYAIKESDLPELTDQIISTILESLPKGNPSVDETGLDRDLTDEDRGWNDCLDAVRKALGEE